MVREKDSGMKTQSSVEYLSMFTATLVLIAIVISVIGLFLLNTGTTTNVPSSCYISAQINCQQLTVASNGTQSKTIIAFTNNLGQAIHFASNSFIVAPTSSQEQYSGSCLPQNALPGAEVVCNATIGGYHPSLGTQLNPRFQVMYSQCKGTDCTQFIGTYNSSGSGTTYVSSSISTLFQVELLTNPSGTGSISLNGVPYPSGTYIELVKNINYNVYANPPSGYTFNGWNETGGAFVNNPVLQGTTLFATSNGTVTATFNAIPTPTVPSVTLTLESSLNAIGNTDDANAITTVPTDSVGIKYCPTSSLDGPCTSAATSLGSGTGSFISNVGNLAAGTYSLQACDLTYKPEICSSNVTLQQVSSYYLDVVPKLTDSGTTQYITGTGKTYHPQGTQATLSTGSNPPAGYYYTFINYTGRCTGSATASCLSPDYYTGTSQTTAITMNGNETEDAYYTAFYVLTLTSSCSGGTGTCAQSISASPSGTGPSGSYLSGTSISLSQTPMPYWHFTGWSGYGGSASSITMPSQPITETANYVRCYTLTVGSTNTARGTAGLVSGQPTSSGGCPSGQYIYGTKVKINATAYSGYTFVHWSDGSTANPYTVNITANTTELATFDKCYLLKFAASPSGGGSPDVSSGYPSSSSGCAFHRYIYGTSLDISANTASGYTFDKWSDGSTASKHSITITANVTMTASYTKNGPTAGCYSSGVTENSNGQCVINGVTTSFCYESDVGNTADCPSSSGTNLMILCEPSGGTAPGGSVETTTDTCVPSDESSD